MKRNEVIRFLILRSIGNFLVLFAIFGFFATFGPALYYEVSFRVLEARGVHFTISNQQTQIQTTNTQGSISNFAQVLAGPKQQILIPPDPNFSIVIPKIGASAKIFPNINASDPNQFLPILMKGVAHAQGTVFPGMNGNIYLFAHSTDNFWDVGRYNAIFYLLKDLKQGDEIAVFFQNKRYNYVVTDTKIVDPSDVSYIVSGRYKTSETLILQTCWPPGTTLQRLLVFAKPK